MEDLPVVWVSALDAEKFCRWLSKKNGNRYRLPTSDEWEAAASCDPENGITRKFPWGDRFEAGKANLSGGQLMKVGSIRQDVSAAGVRDMAGNVSEWTTSPNGSGFVVCGGCCDDAGDAVAARCGFRQDVPSKTKGATLGFRFLMELD
jgi:formylglycine-generating enzyme required for sulfatase activity